VAFGEDASMPEDDCGHDAPAPDEEVDDGDDDRAAVPEETRGDVVVASDEVDDSVAVVVADGDVDAAKGGKVPPGAAACPLSARLFLRRLPSRLFPACRLVAAVNHRAIGTTSYQIIGNEFECCRLQIGIVQ